MASNQVQNAGTPAISVHLHGLVETIRSVVKSELQAQAEAIASTNPAPTNEAPEYLTRAQACEMLFITQTTLTTWKRKNILTPVKIGGRTLYRRSDILKAMQGQRGERISKRKQKGGEQ